MNITFDVENICQNKTPFHIKSIEDIRSVRPIPHQNKKNVQENKSKYQIKWSDTWGDSTKFREKARTPTLHISSNKVHKILDRAIGQQNEIKGTHIGREEVNVSLLVHDMRNKKKYSREILQLINNLCEEKKITQTNQWLSFI